MPFWNSPQSSLKNHRISIWCTLSVALLQKWVWWPLFLFHIMEEIWLCCDWKADYRWQRDYKNNSCWQMHKTMKGTLWVLHSALNTFSLLLLSCQVTTRATRFSPWKPSSWSCCLYSRLFWALCLPFPWWNSIWIFWHQQSQSPCHHSLQAHKWRNRWCSEYRGGTCNLQKAFVCHFWWCDTRSWLCPSHPEVDIKAFSRL